MKKVAIFLVILFFLNILDSETIDIAIWVSSAPESNALQGSIQAFQEDFPNYKVKVSVEGENLINKAQVTKEKAADLLLWSHDTLGKSAADGLILPIKMSDKMREFFLPEAIQAVTLDGQVWGFPVNIENNSIIYRKDKLSKEDLEILDILKKGNSPLFAGDFFELVKKYPTSWDLKNFYFTFAILAKGYGNIEEFIVAVKKQEPQFVQNCKDFLSLLQYIHKGSDYNTTETGFMSGKYAISINGPWSHPNLENAKIPFGVIPLSFFKMGGQALKPFLGIRVFYINKHRKNADICKLFLENYVLPAEAQVAAYRFNPRTPASKEAIKTLGLSQVEGIPMPNNPKSAAIWDIMSSFLQHLIEKGLSKELLEETANKL